MRFTVMTAIHDGHVSKRSRPTLLLGNHEVKLAPQRSLIQHFEYSKIMGQTDCPQKLRQAEISIAFGG